MNPSAHADRGALLFEYRPPAAHPIVYAGLIVFTAVFAMGSIEIVARGADATLFGWYALPLALTAWLWIALRPSPTRIHEHGIAPARPLLLRWRRPFIRWEDLSAVYPSFYDVTGAFVSPFASSDGKVTQMGLALEGKDGRVETVRFTPTRFTMWQAESPGYVAAMDVVRTRFGDRPLVPAAKTYSPDEADTMMEAAGRPFLPFFAIVLLFASAAPVLFLLSNLASLPIWVGLPLSLAAPVWVSLRSWVQSRRRHAILNQLSKAAEYQRGRREVA